jgi:hypothetical protein
MTVQVDRRQLEEPAGSYCDHHRDFVEPGVLTRAYHKGSPYRMCQPCIDVEVAKIAARETYCPSCHYLFSFHRDGQCPKELGPDGARDQAGDP